MSSTVVAFPRTVAAPVAMLSGMATSACAAALVVAFPRASRVMPAPASRPARLTRAMRARASRTPALFRQFRALSERLGRDEAAQREALGLSEGVWQAWIAAEARGAAPDGIPDPELAGHLAWQNYLALGLLAVAGRFGPGGDGVR